MAQKIGSTFVVDLASTDNLRTMSYRIFMIKIPISNLDHHRKKKKSNN